MRIAMNCAWLRGELIREWDHMKLATKHTLHHNVKSHTIQSTGSLRWEIFSEIMEAINDG